MSDEESTVTYCVVVNHEEQYSIWPEYKGEPPAGWRAVGTRGSKEECLNHIEQIWVDMRPLSLRKHMEEQKHELESARSSDDDSSEAPADDLIERLTRTQNVEVALRPERTTSRLQEAIADGYVHIKFTDTRGGTELGVAIDNGASDFSRADYSGARGTIQVVGNLSLNFRDVRCLAEIDLARLAGTGRLELLDVDP